MQDLAGSRSLSSMPPEGLHSSTTDTTTARSSVAVLIGRITKGNGVVISRTVAGGGGGSVYKGTSVLLYECC